MPKKELTVKKSMSDFTRAYKAKQKLIAREKEDFLFALGKQWTDDDIRKLEDAGMKPITDNRIQPNIHLLTGLERQNRTDFKAFPEGMEDSLKAEIATALFKDAIKRSGFGFKSSDQFKDGITCGESHLELTLDNTDSLLNAKPVWKKEDGNVIFPEPGYREYDLSDARYVYKFKPGLSMDDLISLFPDKESEIENAGNGRIDLQAIIGASEKHVQLKDYPKIGGETGVDEEEYDFDLIERYYKKFVKAYFIGDRVTGNIAKAESKERAQEVIDQEQVEMDDGRERFILIQRNIQEIWYFAHVPGMDKPLADERAWFFPKWKRYPIIPYYARFSTAPLTGDDRHLLIQGIVHGVKGAQEGHNKAEVIMLRHLNSSTNSGWMSEEESWVDPDKVEQFGSAPSVNLEYKAGKPKPERIFPMTLSQGHAQISVTRAESIKDQLGINSDLLATQQSSGDSGRAIALRQRQGLLMVQELFDNLSRTRQIAGKFLLSQLGEIYDTETAKKVLGENFLRKNFPPVTIINPDTHQEEPMKDETGQPMEFDKEMADIEINEVLSGQLDDFDVTVGESVSSETMMIARANDLREMSQAYPGIIPPEIIIEESQLPQSTKARLINSIQSAQAAQQQQVLPAEATPGGALGPLSLGA